MSEKENNIVSKRIEQIDKEQKKFAKLSSAEQQEYLKNGDELFSFVSASLALDNNSKRTSMLDTLSDEADAIYEHAQKIKPLKAIGVHDSVTDTYSNNLLNISTNEDGTSKNSSMFDDYALSNDTLNWALWIALYNDSWVFRKAIDKPAEDEVNCGISFTNAGDMTSIYNDLNQLKPAMIRLLKWGALFGGAICFMMFKGLKDEDYAKPIDYAKIKTGGNVMRMYIVDRWYGCSQDGVKNVTRMSDDDFGKPRYYSIMFPDGKHVRVHHSYILRYEHRDAPAFMKNGMLQGWGYAEGAHILNEIVYNDKLKTSAQSLIDKALIEVIHMPGMRGIFMGTDAKNKEQLQKRLEMVVWARNNNSLTFLDSSDQYEKNEFGGLAGLADLLEQNRWQIAAALDMQGILYGDMKNGMGSDTQAIPSYNKTINGRCDSYYRPVLTKLCKTLFKMHDVNDSPIYTFNAIYKDQADTAKIDMLTKYNALLRELQTDNVISSDQHKSSFRNYMNSGVIAINFMDADKIAAESKNKKEAASELPENLSQDDTNDVPDSTAAESVGVLESQSPKEQHAEAPAATVNVSNEKK